ncbi:MAG TPA: nucleotide pyrophosphohydrolase [Candidatus Avipropionibacterium avicola]|uniref:Nucleotide pyrophosphohydrolase n=1 Tax=Candidatus Avipropionibacterium avicola TaxID=2840701 RepID=A0A9D1GYE4_9ACTN|nr:nucleotide pyrophosphohydrolase [Candidatus Avipropionibacterium avicola]
MRAFSAERDWFRFHDPKSLLLALVGEVGELSEIFQWLPADEAGAQVADEPAATQVRDELADVLLYLVRLADVLEVDLHQAALAKMDKNADKHGIGRTDP